MHKDDITLARLQESKPLMTDAERTQFLQGVRNGMKSPVPSHFIFNQQSMIPLLMVAVLLFGGGGTVLASDSARPGDLLFPVDTALENIRLSLASEVEKSEIRLRLAEERLAEFDDIVTEEIAGADAVNDTTAQASSTYDGTLTEAEADVFTDITIIKVEIGDVKYMLKTNDTTFDEIAEAIASHFDKDLALVKSVLTVEVEDRASRTADELRHALGEKSESRILEALSVLGLYLGQAHQLSSSTPSQDDVVRELFRRIASTTGGLPREVRVRDRDDDSRFEVRTEDGRVRVDIKDGEVRVKTKSNDDGDDDSDDDRGETGDSFEVEADVFTDMTVIEIEIDDEKTTLTTDKTTREGVIDVILARFPELSRAEVDARLDFEVEDRASRSDDLRDEDSDDDDDDNSGSGSDDDEDDDEDEDEDDDSDDDDDDDNSGSGKDDDKDDDD